MNRTKSLKIKTKTAVMILVVLMILLGVLYTFTPPLMAAAVSHYQKGNKPEAAMIVKERLMQYFPQSNQARDVAFDLAVTVLSSENRVFVGPTFSGGGGGALTISTEQAIAYLKRVSQAQGNTQWKYSGFHMVGQLCQTLGDFKQTDYWLNLALQGYREYYPEQTWKIAEITGSLIGLHLEQGDYGKAEALINNGIQEFAKIYELSKYYDWQGDLYYAQSDYEKAKAAYTKAMELEEINWRESMAAQNNSSNNVDTKNMNDAEQINASLELQPVYKHAKIQLAQIESLAEGSSRQGGVAGAIYVGTSPMANVQVYLINDKEYDGRGNHLEDIASQTPVVTDDKGQFSFSKVSPGRYFVVLGFIPKDLEGLGRFKGLGYFAVEDGKTMQLHYTLQPRVKITAPNGRSSFREGDEIDITWEAVPGAVSYTINLTLKADGGYVSRAYKTGIKDTSYSFAPAGLQLRDMNFVFYANPQEGVSSSAILGSFYPGAQVYFQVEALDKAGNAISDSEGYLVQLDENYPSVEIAAINHFSAGDKLLLEDKHEEALKSYQDTLAQNPTDVYTLLSLARLYNYQWGEKTGDMQQALVYYQRLLDLTDETFILEEAASAARMAGDNHMALEIYRRFEERMDPHSFWFHSMGELYFLTGHPEKAIGYYLKYLDSQDMLADLGPIMAMLYVSDNQAALDLLRSKSYSQQPRYSDGGEERVRTADIDLIVTLLQSYANGAPSTLTRSEFKNALCEIMQITGSDRSGQIKIFQEKIRTKEDNDILVRILLELVRDRY
ncbi:hypothetical protein LPY66_16125 [Dehalobacter sp. DCM]|uniref:hypothetical protein n=1 Tax=Dehalobacter sp. DCM TaxID=2907827 RepID=UPI003081668C|nr:hypothetical protein LPY66_16125 [Dehalobacter sp. DCM]